MVFIIKVRPINLTPYKQGQSKEAPVEPEAWRAQREKIEDNFSTLVGGVPAS